MTRTDGPRGFAAMTPERRREIASSGGRAAQKVRKFDRRQAVLPGFELHKSTSKKSKPSPT